jgi:UDP-N-acetylmuramate--alanine ligase
VLHRGDLLAEAARLKRCVAVSGTHGKTTTSGLIAHVLVSIGRDPAYLIGGELRSTGSNAAWGGGDWIVVEADESDRSFLKVAAPEVAVVTNVEVDHHSTYSGQLDVEAAFDAWVADAGTVVAWEEAPVASVDVRYGIGAGSFAASSLELSALGSRFVVDGVEVSLRLPGAHNVLNALGALAALRAAGVPVADAAPALAEFQGAKRRFEWRGLSESGAGVFDDYAHHPTEVEATLSAARTLGAARVVACFQPHLYSRTQRLAREFGRALSLADLVVVVDVYPAREEAADYPGVDGYLVARAASDFARGRPVVWLPRLEQAIEYLGGVLRDGDVLVTLGAGDVVRVAEALAVQADAAPPF